MTCSGIGCFVVRTIYPHRWTHQDGHRFRCTHAIHLSCAYTSHIGVYLGYDKLLVHVNTDPAITAEEVWFGHDSFKWKDMLQPHDGDRHPQKHQGVENNIIGCITHLLTRPLRLHRHYTTTAYLWLFPLKFLQPSKVDLDMIHSLVGTQKFRITFNNVR